VSVFVIDWTETGAPPPICMLRTLTAFDFLRIKKLKHAGILLDSEKS
jgi:hypothetical protein